MRARAALLRSPGAPLTIEDVELAAPVDGEVLVELRATGVCHTDATAAAGLVPLRLPAVLGHEGAGAVLESRAPGIAAGDHVVLSFDSCGACSRCSAGRPAYCESFHALNHSGLRRDGTATMGDVHGSFLGQSSFATHALASGRNAVVVPRDAPLAHLAPLGCGVLTGAGAVFNVLQPTAGTSLAVFGLGTVGLAAVMAGAAAGCDPIVGVDPDPARRSLALDVGATRVAEPGEKLRGFDFAVEAVGTSDVVAAAVRCLASPGVCATLGFRGPRNEVTIDQGHLLFGRTLCGVIEGDADPQVLIPALADLYRAGRLPIDRLVTEFAFEDVNAALAAGGDVIKPVLVFET